MAAVHQNDLDLRYEEHQALNVDTKVWRTYRQGHVKVILGHSENLDTEGVKVTIQSMSLQGYCQVNVKG